HRHHRPFGRQHRLRQGALSAAAALFHRLSGGDAAQRRLEDRVEIVSLRYEGIILHRTHWQSANEAHLSPLLGGRGRRRSAARGGGEGRAEKLAAQLSSPNPKLAPEGPLLRRRRARPLTRIATR